MTGVTVVIPAYNAGAPLAASLPTIEDHFSLYRFGGYEFSYLIVEDGSSDGTRSVAQRFARWRTNVRVVSHLCHRGIGAVLRTAFNEMRAEYAIVLDAHLAYAPSTGMELLEALERENADIAIATSHVYGGTLPLDSAKRTVKLGVSGAVEALTGIVRAYRVGALKRVGFSSDGIEALAELLARALRGGLRIVAVPAQPWKDQRPCNVRDMLFAWLAAMKYFPVFAFSTSRRQGAR